MLLPAVMVEVAIRQIGPPVRQIADHPPVSLARNCIEAQAAPNLTIG
jgi:hypothetical protein